MCQIIPIASTEVIAYRFNPLVSPPPNVHTEDAVAAPFAFTRKTVKTHDVV